MGKKKKRNRFNCSLDRAGGESAESIQSRIPLFRILFHSLFSITYPTVFLVQSSDEVSSDHFSTSISNKPKQTIEVKWKKKREIPRWE